MAKKMILSTAYGVMLNEVTSDSICKVVADCWLHYFETRKEVKENE